MNFTSLFPTPTLNSSLRGSRCLGLLICPSCPCCWKVLRCVDTVCVLGDVSSYCLHVSPAYLSACELHMTSVSTSVNPGAANRDRVPALGGKIGRIGEYQCQKHLISHLIELTTS